MNSDRYRLAVPRAVVGNISDAAYVGEGDDPRTEIVAAAFAAISTELQVTVGGVTMHVAAWEDPEHWASDWAELLEIDHDDVPEAIEDLIATAKE